MNKELDKINIFCTFLSNEKKDIPKIKKLPIK